MHAFHPGDILHVHHRPLGLSTWVHDSPCLHEVCMHAADLACQQAVMPRPVLSAACHKVKAQQSLLP